VVAFYIWDIVVTLRPSLHQHAGDFCYLCPVLDLLVSGTFLYLVDSLVLVVQVLNSFLEKDAWDVCLSEFIDA
jgi:hypothetical protein